MKLKKIDLSQIESIELDERHLSRLLGGGTPGCCQCGCHYTSSGASSTNDNSSANNAGGQTSNPGMHPCCTPAPQTIYCPKPVQEKITKRHKEQHLSFNFSSCSLLFKILTMSFNNKGLHFIWLLLITNTYLSCSQNSEKVFFEIKQEDRKIIVPVNINGKKINMVFDTGFPLGVFHVDSSFLIHSNEIIFGKTYDSSVVRLGFSFDSGKVYFKNNPNTVKIGNVELQYSNVEIGNWKKLVYNKEIQGIFNIPKNDTNNIWELNFENNYLKIHNQSYEIPKNCFILPMSLQNNDFPFFVRLPILIKSTPSDSLVMNEIFQIDLGMPYDIAFVAPNKNISFFDKYNDAIWMSHSSSYYKRYTVNAVLFGNYCIDSLRIYTFEEPAFGRNLIGLNFLKRFNVFFDMKNKKIGLQPLRNFQRLINPTATRLHFLPQEISKGRFVIKKIANYESNYFKNAGLKEGDEIVSINNILYNNLNKKDIENFNNSDTLLFKIVRNGRIKKIAVPVNKAELQGD